MKKDYDAIIIGGGITGAGIFKELSDTGIDVCIIEQNDFSSGTSSKSSKLVHGGLRYLKEGNIALTFESVHHRERLLKEAPGLVEPVEFIMPIYKNLSPGKLSLGLGLKIYDFMALKLRHKFIPKKRIKARLPMIKDRNLEGAYSFLDAATDDSMLVARLINESLKNKKASFFNYHKVISIEKDKKSNKKIVTIKNEDEKITAISSKLVINACGAWAEEFHKLPDKKMRIRPLKGSHIIISNENLNIESAVSFLHPDDKRPVFLIPWEGVVLVGTTDLDAKSMDDFKISKNEVDYLIKGVKEIFPDFSIDYNNIISSFSGIRPVISSGQSDQIDPSKESREHLVWKDDGIISVTGGKLTTFRKLAWDTIKQCKNYLPELDFNKKQIPLFNQETDFKKTYERRIKGRYGEINLDDYLTKDLIKLIPGTKTYYAEISIASKDKTIKHLDDLLIRRLSLGLILPNGGLDMINEIKTLAAPELKWSDDKWESEISRYKSIYNNFYSPIIS